jgi:dolichol-phosphate mannosyltransferase
LSPLRDATPSREAKWKRKLTAPPGLSVVCPFYNEELIIVAAAERMIGNLKRQFGEDWELILVNDGSTDRSLMLLRESLGAYLGGRLVVLSYPSNFGRGRALKTGIDAARGDIIVTTEVDCSWGDDIVLRLVECLNAHPETDFVVASPHLPGGGLVNVARRRALLTRAGNMLIRFFFDPHISMNTGMTRAYRRAVIQPLVTLEDGKEFHLEVLLKLVTIGFRFREIPATLTWLDHRLAADTSRKRRSSTNILKTISSHLQFIAMARPVQYFGWLAFWASLVGAGFLAAATWNLLFGGPAVFYALIGLVMFLIALLLGGYSVIFYQLREQSRDNWLRSYPKPHPPTAPRPIRIE